MRLADNGDGQMGRAFGYVRVSSASQVKDGESLAVQQQLIEAICKLENWTLAGIFVEEGVSGSKPLATRPEGSKLVRAVQAGDTVVALKLDRLFRDLSDAVTTLAALKKQDVGLFLKDVGGLVSDGVGELVFGLLSTVACFERSRTKERIAEVKAALAREGRYLGGNVPFGSRLVERDGEKFIEPDQQVEDILKDLLAKGYSSRLISGHLMGIGLKVSHHAVSRYVRRSVAKLAA